MASSGDFTSPSPFLALALGEDSLLEGAVLGVTDA